MSKTFNNNKGKKKRKEIHDLVFSQIINESKHICPAHFGFVFGVQIIPLLKTFLASLNFSIFASFGCTN